MYPLASGSQCIPTYRLQHMQNPFGEWPTFAARWSSALTFNDFDWSMVIFCIDLQWFWLDNGGYRRMMRTLLEILSSSRGIQHTTPITRDLHLCVRNLEFWNSETNVRDHILDYITLGITNVTIVNECLWIPLNTLWFIVWISLLTPFEPLNMHCQRHNGPRVFSL